MSNATGQLVERAPEAIAKLKKGGDVSKLTIVEMCAIAFASFNGTVLKGNKAAHTLQLESLIAAQPKVLDAAAAATTAATTAATVVVAIVTRVAHGRLRRVLGKLER